MATVALAVMTCTLPLHADHEKITKSFIHAFRDGNPTEMAQHFAEDIQFIGDHRFIGRKDGLTKPVSISKEQLERSYADLLEARRTQWAAVTKKLKPTTTMSEDGGEILGLVEKGDIICDMHFREASKGERSGFDEAVIFVFRKIEGAYKIVIHLADY